MASGTGHDVAWLDALEAEFDSVFRELFQDLSEPPLTEAESTAHQALVKRRVTGLASALGQVVQKARVLNQRNRDRKAEVDKLKADLVQAKTANSALARELRSRTLQVRSLEVQLRLRAGAGAEEEEEGGSGGVGREFNKEVDSLRAQLEFEIESYHQSPAEGDALKCQQELLEEENTALHMCVQSLYTELAADSLATAYMEMELTGRVQQLQLLVKGVTGDELKQLWQQLYTEITLQKNKRLLLAYQARDTSLDRCFPRETTSAVGDQELRKKVLEFAQKRSLGLPKGRNVREVVILKNETESLGMSITGGSQLSSPILISNLEDNKPAHSSGKLQIGDALISVNDQSLVDKTHQEAVHLLRNSGSKVVLKVVFMLGVVGERSTGAQPLGTDTAVRQALTEGNLSDNGQRREGEDGQETSTLSDTLESVFTAVERLSSQDDQAEQGHSETPPQSQPVRSNTDKLAASFALHSPAPSSSSTALVGRNPSHDGPLFSHNEVDDYKSSTLTAAAGAGDDGSPRLVHSDAASQWREGNPNPRDDSSVNEDSLFADSVPRPEGSSFVGGDNAGTSATGTPKRYGLQVHVLPVSVQAESIDREGPHLFRTDS